jgi:hypothetical protein
MILVLLALFSGHGPALTPFELIEEATQLNCPASDDPCLGREFALRGRADQSLRRASAADLGCADADEQCVSEAWSRVDADNLARLKSIVGVRGWPSFEGEAARGAWLIAQHADPSPSGPDRAFRDLVLPMIWEEVSAGRLEPQDYARMIDRNALADGEHQPFGTNQACREGRFDRASVDSVEEVDRRRREIGMDIMLSESLSLWDSFCARTV